MAWHIFSVSEGNLIGNKPESGGQSVIKVPNL